MYFSKFPAGSEDPVAGCSDMVIYLGTAAYDDEIVVVERWLNGGRENVRYSSCKYNRVKP